jgi:hypothetical protein
MDLPSFWLPFARSLVPMTIAAIATDDGFIDLNNPAKLLHVLNEGGSDLVAHKPSRFVRTEAHVAKDLEGAHSLLRNKHKVRDAEPIFERLIRIFKNCPGKVREAVTHVTTRRALGALPMPSAAMKFIDSIVPATRAAHTVRPTPNDQILDAIVLSFKQRIELRCGHLMDGLRLFCAGHVGFPQIVGAEWHV